MHPLFFVKFSTGDKETDTRNQLICTAAEVNEYT